MSDRVIKILQGEIEKLQKNNEVMDKQAEFYLQRVSEYNTTIDDNKAIITQCLAQIDVLNHEASRRQDIQNLMRAQNEMLDAAIKQNKIERDKFHSKF